MRDATSHPFWCSENNSLSTYFHALQLTFLLASGRKMWHFDTHDGFVNDKTECVALNTANVVFHFYIRIEKWD